VEPGARTINECVENTSSKVSKWSARRGTRDKNNTYTITYMYTYIVISSMTMMIIIICPGLKLFIWRVLVIRAHAILLCVRTYYGRGNLVSEHKRPATYKEQRLSNGKKKKNTAERINAFRLRVWGLGYYSAITRPVSQPLCLVRYYLVV